MPKKVIFIPGNGGGTTNNNWCPSLKEKLEAVGLEVTAEEFPDEDLTRSSFWLPFLINELKADKNTILIGHSTGAIASMRLAERQPVFNHALVGAYYTDLNMEKEKLSGYFDTPWNWEKIQRNQKCIILFASQNDLWIPIDQLHFIHTQLNCEYHAYKNEGHFGGDYYKPTFDELAYAVIRNVKGMDEQ